MQRIWDYGIEGLHRIGSSCIKDVQRIRDYVIEEMYRKWDVANEGSNII